MGKHRDNRAKPRPTNTPPTHPATQTCGKCGGTFQSGVIPAAIHKTVCKGK